MLARMSDGTASLAPFIIGGDILGHGMEHADGEGGGDGGPRLPDLEGVGNLFPLFLVKDIKGHDFSDLSGLEIFWVIRRRRKLGEKHCTICARIEEELLVRAHIPGGWEPG